MKSLSPVQIDLKNKAKDFFLSIFPEYQQQIQEIEKITNNFSNHIFKLTTTSSKFFKIRIANHNHLISRSNELAILKVVKDPLLLYYDKITGNAIYQWLEGRNLRPEDITREILSEVLQEAKKYHQSSCGKDILLHDPLDYFEQAKDDIDGLYISKYLSLIERHKDLSTALCHNDISLKNLILSANSLVLIDYEWGRINTPYWDIGNFIREAGAARKEIKYLSNIFSLSYEVLLDFVYIATFYSLQLTYSFPNQDTLAHYRSKLITQLDIYLSWLI